MASKRFCALRDAVLKPVRSKAFRAALVAEREWHEEVTCLTPIDKRRALTLRWLAPHELAFAAERVRLVKAALLPGLDEPTERKLHLQRAHADWLLDEIEDAQNGAHSDALAAPCTA